MGALIAFELTRLLRDRASPLPDHLFVSGRRAPQFPEDDPPSYNLPDEELIKKLRLKLPSLSFLISNSSPSDKIFSFVSRNSQTLLRWLQMRVQSNLPSCVDSISL